MILAATVATVRAQVFDGNRMLLHHQGKVAQVYAVQDVDSITFKYVEGTEIGLAVKSTTAFTATVECTKPAACSKYYVAAVPASYTGDLASYVKGASAEARTESATVELTGLSSNANYKVAALSVDAYGIESAIATESFTTATSSYTKVESEYFDVDYWGDVYHNGFENFIIRMGNCDHNGALPLGNGDFYNFSVYNAKLADANNPMPAVGTYTLYTGEQPIDMCLESTESRLFVISNFKTSADYSRADVGYEAATLTIVKNSDGTYTATALLDLENGKHIELTYTGNVKFADKSFKGYEGPQLAKDLTFDCDYATTYTDDGEYFEIMDGGDPSADGASWFKRNRLAIYLKANGGLPPVGTFSVENGDITKGEYMDYGGGIKGAVGTTYYYLESVVSEPVYGFIASGTVTVSLDASTGKYTIATDLKTDKGYAVKATYVGPMQKNQTSTSAAAKARVPAAPRK